MLTKLTCHIQVEPAECVHNVMVSKDRVNPHTKIYMFFPLSEEMYHRVGQMNDAIVHH